MKRFRLLKPDEIECRVQTCKDNGVSLLLYKTARTDADLLDETVGAENWENDFKLVDGVLYGGIGVDYGKGLVWKWDAGTESQTESDKGRASDAYKRAGFKHGIGRELYSAPSIWIGSDKCTIKQGKNGKPACFDDFEVAEIRYDDQERISNIRIVIGDRTVYSFGSAVPVPGRSTTPVSEMQFRCERCGDVLRPYTDKNGKNVPIRKHAEGSKAKFGRVLCLDCIGGADENH